VRPEINDPLFLGWNAQTGKRVFITRAQRETHFLSLGRSGGGKTSHYEFMIRQDIRAGRGVCVLDPEGTLFGKLLHYCAKRRSTWDRVVIIDPNDETYRFGLNYFDLDLPIQKRVDLWIAASYKVVGQNERETKVLLERWGDVAAKLLALHDPPLTLAELYPILTDENLRRTVLQRIPEETAAHVHQEWRFFDEQLTRSDRASHLLAVIDRAVKFTRDDRMKEMLGQPNRIDWRTAMDNGWIVLVNLHPDRATSMLTQMAGVMLIHQIVEAALRRPEGRATPPFYVYVDEFASLVTPDFQKAIQRLRKRGCPFILAQQNLEDFKIEDDGKLYHAAMQSMTNKLVFNFQDAEEAAAVANHIFSAEITGEEIKYQGPDTVQAIPIARSEEVERVTSTHNSQRGGSAGTGNQAGDSESATYNPNSDEAITTKGLSLADHSSRQDTWSEGDTESRQTGTERWTEYEYRTLPQTPVFRTVEESLHGYKREIMRLDVGEAFIKYDAAKPPVFLRTPKPGSKVFPTVRASPEVLAELKQHVYSRLGILTSEQARRLIADRGAAIRALPPPAQSHDSGADWREAQANLKATARQMRKPRSKT
jgi:hypothetical protein